MWREVSAGWWRPECWETSGASSSSSSNHDYLPSTLAATLLEEVARTRDLSRTPNGQGKRKQSDGG